MDTDPHETDEASSTSKTDGGAVPGFDEATLYSVVRAAVKDALLDVVGTLLLVGVAFVIILIGGSILLSPISPLGRASGVIVIAGGFYSAGVALGIIPSIRDLI